MDCGCNNRYLHNFRQRVKKWKERRARIKIIRQRNRSRTEGNYRQPSNLQPRQRHPEDPRYYNHGGDPRWNPNYNYSGYWEHNVPHYQYQHQHDYRVDHWSHGSYHQGQRQKRKRGHYSSQKSLYNNTKPVNNPSRQCSSSSNINSTNEIKSENLVSEPNSSKSTLEDNTGTCVTIKPEPESQLDNASSMISPDLEIVRWEKGCNRSYSDLRISSVRTPISKQNLCVQKLEELSPEVKQKMKFVPNPSINTPSDS